MSKRKRSTPKESASDSPSEGDPSVHVSPDVLAGSPDVFAPRKETPAETPEPEATTADITDAEPKAPAEETAAETPAEAAVVESPPPPAAPYQPHAPAYVPPAQPSRRGGSTIALGVVLVVLGLFALLVQFTGFDA